MKTEYIPDAVQQRASDKYRHLTTASIPSLTIEESNEAIDYVTKSLTSIKQQIAMAKRGHAAEGIKSDWQWLTRTEAARSALGHLHQELLRHRAIMVKARKIAEGDAQQRDKVSVFIRIVRDRVGQETFLKWMAEADLIANTNAAGGAL
jgi:hypothetical protein